MTNDKKQFECVTPGSEAIRATDDVAELIRIAQFLATIKHWEAQAGSKVLAEIAQRLLKSSAGAGEQQEPVAWDMQFMDERGISRREIFWEQDHMLRHLEHNQKARNLEVLVTPLYAAPASNPKEPADPWRCPDCGNGDEMSHRGCELRSASKAMAADTGMGQELPPLPVPTYFYPADPESPIFTYFTADQMLKYARAALSAAPQNPKDQEQLEKERDGWKWQAQHNQRRLEDCRRSLDLRALHEHGDVWYWQDDGEDHIESMSNGMGVFLTAGTLRRLIAQSVSPLPNTEEKQ